MDVKRLNLYEYNGRSVWYVDDALEFVKAHRNIFADRIIRKVVHKPYPIAILEISTKYTTDKYTLQPTNEVLVRSRWLWIFYKDFYITYELDEKEKAPKVLQEIKQYIEQNKDKLLTANEEPTTNYEPTP